MRLRTEEREAIVRAVRCLDPQGKVYLFGSRVDDSAKGGDIDLLVFSNKTALEDKLCLKKNIYASIEEQKIDIIITRDGQESFVKHILPQCVQLL